MSDKDQLRRQNIKQYLFDLKDEEGNFNDVVLQDGMYVMIINKWPEPLNFKVEIEEIKEPWTQAYLRYTRGIPEPEGSRRRLQECEVPPCDGGEEEDLEEFEEGEEEAEKEKGFFDTYEDLMYFLIIMGI